MSPPFSVLWGRVKGAGLCSLFSNFRFGMAETGSIFYGDRFSWCPRGIGRDLGIVSISVASDCAALRSPRIFATVVVVDPTRVDQNTSDDAARCQIDRSASHHHIHGLLGAAIGDGAASSLVDERVNT